MRDDLLPIGQMAEINHITVATLRLYDKMGLLHPRHIDSSSGYRYYDIEQNARLDMIAYMKELGMSLAEIGDVLRREDLTLIEGILVQKNEQIHQQMRELRARHDAVERAIASIERYRKSPSTGTISLEYIDRRYIWGIPCSTNFYAQDIRSYEKVLIEFRQALMKHGVPQVHSYNVGTSIAMADYLQERYIAERVFIFSDRPIEGTGIESAVIDSGMYACIYLDDYDAEVRCAKALLDYCRENDYAISGNYICEVLSEFSVFDDTHRGMFMRLQVPVSFRKNVP